MSKSYRFFCYNHLLRFINFKRHTNYRQNLFGDKNVFDELRHCLQISALYIRPGPRSLRFDSVVLFEMCLEGQFVYRLLMVFCPSWIADQK